METFQVPVLDISPLLSSRNIKSYAENNKSVSALTREISNACKTWGFFYVVNHNIDAKLIASVESEGLKFFRLSKDQKDAVARFEGNFQGYADAELTKQKVDWKQVFDFSSEDSFESAHNTSLISEIHGKNQWPSCEILPDFKSTLTTYFTEVRKLALILMQAVFQGLLDAEFDSLDPSQTLMDDCFSSEEDRSFTRLNYYPEYDSSNSSCDQLCVGPHSDPGVLTVLYQQEGVNSLQVLKDGLFYDVPPIKDSFVINIGDMTQVWSNDRYKAPVHRVLTNPSKSRFSLPFFLSPRYSCVIEPLCDSKSKIYKPILWGDFIKGRILGNYADLGEELQISHYLINRQPENNDIVI